MTPTSPLEPAPAGGEAALTEPGEALRWARALAIVAAVHALPLVVAAWWLGPQIRKPAPEPAIVVDLAPPAAPTVAPSEQPPGPKQVKADTPQTRVERPQDKSPPAPNPAVALPARPPEPPKVDAQERAPATTAPPARPQPPAPRASSGQPTWEDLVLGALDKVKRYPRDAQRQRHQGVAYIRFVMTRDGRVLSTRLERGSGVRTLDAEAVALPRRAQPLPKAPDEVQPGSSTIELVAPVEFFLA